MAVLLKARASLGVMCICVSASALPPLGLTQVQSAPDANSRIGVADSDVYVTTSNGVRLIGQGGVGGLVAFSHPTLGAATQISRLTQGIDGELYVAVELSGGDSALLNVAVPSTPVATWFGVSNIVGLDQTLRAIGFPGDSLFYTELFADGSTDDIIDPWSNIFDVSVGGTLAGAFATGPIGAGAAFQVPQQNVTTLSVLGVATSVNDRADGGGVNVGYSTSHYSVLYGDSPPIEIDQALGAVDLGVVHVSESDFVVVETFNGDGSALAYFPGINPLGPDRSRLLNDVFPALEPIDVFRVTDIASVDGRLNILVSGSDGLYLYSVADPTVVPEPNGAAILLLGLAPFAGRRGRARMAGLLHGNGFSIPSRCCTGTASGA